MRQKTGTKRIKQLGWLSKKSDPLGFEQEIKICRLVDFAVPPGVKIKENKKIDKYLDLTRELKKL